MSPSATLPVMPRQAHAGFLEGDVQATFTDDERGAVWLLAFKELRGGHRAGVNVLLFDFDAHAGKRRPILRVDSQPGRGETSEDAEAEARGIPPRCLMLVACHAPQLGKLRGIWASLTGPGNIYSVREWITRLIQSDGLDFGASPNIYRLSQ